jgi:hypothetical protein
MITLDTYFKDNHIYISYYCADGRLQCSSKIKCTKEEWGRFTKLQQTRLNRLDLIATEYVSACQISGQPVLKKELKAKLFPTVTKTVKTKTVLQAVEQMEGMMWRRELLQKRDSKPYSESAIKIVRTIKQHLAEYPSLGGISLQNFNHFDEFKSILLSQGKSQNTLSSYITYFKMVFSLGYKLKWHTNESFKEEGISVPPEAVDYAVHCSFDELDTIYTLEIDDSYRFKKLIKNKQVVFSGKYLKRVRDLFVFGSQIALRHSDLFEIEDEKVNDWVINVDTRKKGVVVYVPMNARAREIWTKYKGNVPKIANANFNHCIKEICRLAGLNETTLFSRTEGGKKVSRYVPKWELIGTHTMRRNFATNYYIGDEKRGIPPLPLKRIMLITGHSTETSFFKYIRLKGKENAESLKSHPAFR